MTIRILCVGKIKEAFYRDAMAELIKRMGRYAAAEVIEVAEEKAPEGLSAAEKERILASEGERLLGKTDERDHVTVLCIEGKKLTSEAFAAHINAAMLAGKSRMVFIIGGRPKVEEVNRYIKERICRSFFLFTILIISNHSTHTCDRNGRVNAWFCAAAPRPQGPHRCLRWP